MGVLRKLYKEKNKIAVDIPPSILPDKYKIPKPTRMLYPRILERNTYVYGGRGPTPEESISAAIAAAKRGRYRVGIWVPRRWVEDYGFPVDLKLVAVYDPAKKRWIEITEKPTLSLVEYGAGRWRAQFPVDIVRKYNMYALPTRHPMYRDYAMRARLQWTSYTRVLRPEKPKIYHFHNIYEPDWNTEKTLWTWYIPDEITKDEGLEKAFEIEERPEARRRLISPVPDAQLHYNDTEDVVEVQFIIPRVWDKTVGSMVGKAYRNMVVRNYTLKEEVKMEEAGTPSDFLIEIRATLITTPPREFYEGHGYHMPIVAPEGEMAALNITCYNIMRYFFMQTAERRGHLYNPLLSHKFAEKVEETIGYEDNVEVDFGEVEKERFGYVIKYIRIVNRSSKRRGKDWVYTTDEIDRKIKQMGGIVDENGFVWRGL